MIPQNHLRQRFWVVFTDETDLAWLKILRRGFRHCFVIIHDGKNWISIDPLSTRLEIAVQNVPPEFDLPLWLKSRGHRVLRVLILEKILRPAPVMLFSCVEAAKRIIGIQSRRIITPYQLYCFLSRPHHKNKGVLSWEV